ncbi:hypothetical protein NEF87_004290 [Candidatus Lokiarchaeum ossiferum]|uniref:Glycosyltransferase 2-like domain-containing protein n=1 Tax=Candidatus Lokiarchaeum ossiferum TaxID=2951803 RepID=A0ABY6HX65_9ARCH|nr:hypothetical protein NEF87_004290 [Candidatus Lokiarchaeum sp. B-35]
MENEQISSNYNLTVIFVNYHSFSLLKAALSTLDDQIYHNFQIAIVDNTPGVVEYQKLQQLVQKRKTDRNLATIHLFKPKFNLGFAGGNNFAIKRLNSDFYFLLNCDTEIPTPDFLSQIMEYLYNHPAVGFLSPKMLFYAAPMRIWYAGAQIAPSKFSFISHNGLYKLDSSTYSQIRETDFACGAAMFVSHKVIQKVGLLDELFFMYAEETDWNVRAKHAGFQIIYFPPVSLFHKVDLFTESNKWGYRKNYFQVYLYNRNKIIFMLKNYAGREIFLFFTRYELKTLVAELYLAIKMNQPLFIKDFLQSIVRGVQIGIRRRTHRTCSTLLRKEMAFLSRVQKVSRSTSSSQKVDCNN